MHVFISYAKIDSRTLAYDLFQSINALEGFTAWMDLSLEPAESWAMQIQEEIDRADAIILLLSPDVNRPISAMQRRSFVLNEIDYAQQLHKRIVPIMAQQTKVPVQIAGLEYIDFVNDVTKGRERLFRTLYRLAGIANPNPSSSQTTESIQTVSQAPKLASTGRNYVIIGTLIVLILVLGSALTFELLNSPADKDLTTPETNLVAQVTDEPSPTATLSETASLTPTETPSPTDALSSTNTPNPEPSLTASETEVSPANSLVDTAILSPSATNSPSATATDNPTETPTDRPSATPTHRPTATATDNPTETPTDRPSATPTHRPTATATDNPTETPTDRPTVQLTPIDTSALTPTEVAICLIQANSSEVVARVGPGENRTSLVRLNRNETYAVSGKYLVEEGEQWWQIDTEQLERDVAATVLFVNAAEVTSTGDCTLVADVNAPPVIPIASSGGTSGSTTANTNVVASTNQNLVDRAVIACPSVNPTRFFNLGYYFPLQAGRYYDIFVESVYDDLLVYGYLINRNQTGSTQVSVISHTYQCIYNAPDSDSNYQVIYYYAPVRVRVIDGAYVQYWDGYFIPNYELTEVTGWTMIGAGNWVVGANIYTDAPLPSSN